MFQEPADGLSGERRRKSVACLLADCDDDFVLAGEVPVDGSVGEPGLGDDVGYRGPGEAVAGEPGAGGIEDLLAAGIEVRLSYGGRLPCAGSGWCPRRSG
jgi:hypothetical protein